MAGVVARMWEGLTLKVDSFLFGIALAIAGVGLVTLFSASDQSVARITSQTSSLAVGLVLMWIVANIAPQTIARAAVPLYVLAVVMLIGVVIIVGALTFFPKLALGPIVEHFMMVAG